MVEDVRLVTNIARTVEAACLRRTAAHESGEHRVGERTPRAVGNRSRRSGDGGTFRHATGRCRELDMHDGCRLRGEWGVQNVCRLQVSQIAVLSPEAPEESMCNGSGTASGQSDAHRLRHGRCDQPRVVLGQGE